MNLRYAGIIGETRGESQHTAWTANCPKTGQKRQIKGCKKTCFTAWSKGTAYTRDTFISQYKCVMPRARIMRTGTHAHTRVREKSGRLSVCRTCGFLGANLPHLRLLSGGIAARAAQIAAPAETVSVGLNGLQGLGEALVSAILAVFACIHRTGDRAGVRSNDRAGAVGDGRRRGRRRKSEKPIHRNGVCHTDSV